MLLPHTRFGPVLSSSSASRLDARFAGRSGDRPLSALVGLERGRVGGGDVVLSIIDATSGELLARRRRWTQIRKQRR